MNKIFFFFTILFSIPGVVLAADIRSDQTDYRITQGETEITIKIVNNDTAVNSSGVTVNTLDAGTNINIKSNQTDFINKTLDSSGLPIILGINESIEPKIYGISIDLSYYELDQPSQINSVEVKLDLIVKPKPTQEPQSETKTQDFELEIESAPTIEKPAIRFLIINKGDQPLQLTDFKIEGNDKITLNDPRIDNIKSSPIAGGDEKDIKLILKIDESITDASATLTVSVDGIGSRSKSFDVGGISSGTDEVDKDNQLTTSHNCAFTYTGFKLNGKSKNAIQTEAGEIIVQLGKIKKGTDYDLILGINYTCEGKYYIDIETPPELKIEYAILDTLHFTEKDQSEDIKLNISINDTVNESRRLLKFNLSLYDEESNYEISKALIAFEFDIKSDSLSSLNEIWSKLGITGQIVIIFLFASIVAVIIMRKQLSQFFGISSKKVKIFRLKIEDNYGRGVTDATVTLKKVMDSGSLHKVDERYVQKDDVHFPDVEEGDYIIEVSKPGYQQGNKKISIGGDKESREYTQESIQLAIQSEQPSFGSSSQVTPQQQFKVGIVVTDEEKSPINATIELGGVTKNGSNVSFLAFPGDYPLKVSSEGHGSVTKTIKINGNDTKAITLIKNFGEIEINVSTVNGTPISNATVQIDNQSFTTDSRGQVSASLKPDPYTISVSKNMYNTNSTNVTIVSGHNNPVRLVLTPSISLSGDHNMRLQNAFQQIQNSSSEIGGSTYNQTIPKYFLKVGEAIIRSIRTESERVEKYPTEESFNSAMGDYVRAVEVSFPIIAQGMLERRNLSLYSQANSIPSQDPPDIDITSSMSSPDPVKMKLSELDNSITKETASITVHPITVLWRAGQEIMKYSTPGSAFVADIIVESAQKMLTMPTLRQVLEVRI